MSSIPVISIQEYISIQPLGHQVELIKAIRHYQKYESSIRGQFCEICDKPLLSIDRLHHTHTMFLYTCYEHIGYAEKFQVDLIRKELGYPERINLLRV